MTNVLIIYATDYGNTKKMAESVASGAKSIKDTKVVMKDAESATAEDLLDCHALIIGTPVHMGSADWRIKKFIDKVCSGLWIKDKLIGRICGVFASGGGFGNAGGGCEIALLSILNNCAELGMIFVPLPKNTPGYRSGGIQWGPCGRSGGPDMEHIEVSKEALQVAHHHGANIARVASTVKDGSQLFAKAEPAQHK